MIVSVFLFPFFFQFSIQYVGGKLYLFVTGIYILPFGWLNSDLKKIRNCGDIGWNLKEHQLGAKEICYYRPHMALISEYYLAIM